MSWSELVGKTILSVDETFGANVVRINFTDGTTVVIDTEAIGLGLYRPVAISPVSYD